MNADAKKHWHDVREISSNHPWQFRFMLWMVKSLPRPLVLCITVAVCFFFFLGARPINENSRKFFARLSKIDGKHYGFWDCYKRILSFAITMMERLYNFMGTRTLKDLEHLDDSEELFNRLRSGKGALILSSHLGNMESFRSMKKHDSEDSLKNLKIVPVADFSGTSKFNDLLRELDPELMATVIDANDIGPDTIMYISDIVEHCGIVIIAADRISANSRDRILEAKFLGETVQLPEGPFTLASLIDAPIYTGFGIRKKNFSLNSTYEFHVHHMKTSLHGPRASRKERILQLAQEFASLEELYCRTHPYQWYNFYNFWGQAK